MTDLGRLLGAAARRDAADGSLAAAKLLAESAGPAGLIDVAYADFDSPLGRLLVATTRRGLVRVSYMRTQDEAAVLQRLAEEVSPRVLEAPARVDDVRRQLDEYFAGKRRRFELPLDWRLIHGFGRRVLRATARVDYGRTTTYARLAANAGNARAYRAAGNALNRNPVPIVVPCHRVLNTGGGLGGYAGGLPVKERLLRLEGAL